MQPSVDTKRITGSTETHDAIAKGIAKELRAKCVSTTDYENWITPAETPDKNWYQFNFKKWWKWRRDIVSIVLYDGKIYVGIAYNYGNSIDLADPNLIKLIKNYIATHRPK